MKNRNLKYLAISGLIIFNSCSTIMFINKPLEPEIILEENEKSLVVNNYFDYTQPAYVKEKHQEVYKASAEFFSESLTKYINISPGLIAISGDSLISLSVKRSPSDLMPANNVLEACEKFGADMLLSIDSIDIDFDWETETIINDDGEKSKTKYFYIQTTHFLSLYSSSGELIDRSFIALEQPYSARPTISGLITIKPNLRKAIDEVIIISADAGIEYGTKFFETTGTYPYKVYHNKPFEESFSLLQSGNWSDAIRSLLLLAESSDKKIAKRAANNLFVAYTGIGDEVSAEEWRLKAL